MKIVFRQTPLYRFLNYCNSKNLEKTVLDCGAGGNCPPLALFSYHDYKTFGIELSDEQLDKAKKFGEDNNLKLNIAKGDIRNLPFEDNSISYIYSYNTIFHMNKEDIAEVINEIKRVLKPGGLCFINFLSINDFNYGEGKELGNGSFLQMEDGNEVIHSYYEINEAEKHFYDMNIIFKENRILERIYEGERITQGYIDYIVEK